MTMTNSQIIEITRELRTMAVLNGKAEGGTCNMISAVRVDIARKKGTAAGNYRIDFYILGQRSTRAAAAHYLQQTADRAAQ